MKRFILNVFLMIFYFLLTNPLAAAGTVSVDDNLGMVNITGSLDYLEDREHAFSVDEVTKKDTGWKPVRDDSVSLGYSSSRYWFRFTIVNYVPDNISYMLEVDNPLLDTIRLYIPDESGVYLIKQSGDSSPFFTRDVDDKNIIFRIQQEAGKRTCYFSVSSLDGINFRVSVMSAEAYLAKVKADFFLNLIFLGVMIIMVVYNLAVFVSMRKANYVYLLLFIIFSILSEAAQSGFGYQYFWTQSVWLQERLSFVLAGCTMLSLALFMISFDVVRKKYPLIFKFHIATIVLPVSVFLIFSFILKREVISLAAIILILYVVCFFLVVELYSALKRRSRPAIMLLGGYIFLSTGILIDMFVRLGLFPVNAFTTSFMKLGTIIFVFVMSFALTHRIIARRQILMNKISQLESKVRERIIGLYETDGLWGPEDN